MAEAEYSPASLNPTRNSSEQTPSGLKKTSLDHILLNGNNVCLLVPGGTYVGPLWICCGWMLKTHIAYLVAQKKLLYEEEHPNDEYRGHI